jgi:hypothetical protein
MLPHTSDVLEIGVQEAPLPSWWPEKVKLAFGNTREQCDRAAMNELLHDRLSALFSGLAREWDAGEEALAEAALATWEDMQVRIMLCVCA